MLRGVAILDLKRTILVNFLYNIIKIFFFLIPESGLIPVPNEQLKNYYKSIADHKDVTKIVLMLSSAVNSFRQEITDSLNAYVSFKFLWEEDRDQTVAVCIFSANLFLIFNNNNKIILFIFPANHNQSFYNGQHGTILDKNAILAFVGYKDSI